MVGVRKKRLSYMFGMSLVAGFVSVASPAASQGMVPDLLAPTIGCPASVHAVAPPGPWKSTTSELARIGLPPGGYLYRQAKAGHIHWLDRLTCGAPRKISRPYQQSRPEMHALDEPVEQTSSNWAGYQMRFTGTPVDVELTYQQPVNVVASTTTEQSTVVFWGGIGTGDSTNDQYLIQAGSTIDLNTPSHQRVDKLFYEIFPKESLIPVEDPLVGPGYFVSVAATARLADDGSTTARFFLCSGTSSDALTCAPPIDDLSPGKPDGTAEWIAERPTVGGSYHTLPNVPPFYFMNSAYNYVKPDGTYPSLSVLPLIPPPSPYGSIHRITMTDRGDADGTRLAYVGDIEPPAGGAYGDFQVTVVGD